MTGEVVLILRILAAVCLYVFLAWGIFTIWRELKRYTDTLSERKVPPLYLSWDIDSQSIAQEYKRARVTIGRDPSCDCPLKDETVSAHHALMSYHHMQWWIEDLKSTNGTFLNEEKLDTPTVIVSGDEIRCGQIPVKVQIDGQDAQIELFSRS